MTYFAKVFYANLLGYLGVPYRWGGQSDEEVDCSGLVIQVLRGVPGFGTVPDRDADGLYKEFTRATKSGDTPYDVRLGFFVDAKSGKATHVVALLPNSEHYVHAASSLGSVEVGRDQENVTHVRFLDFNCLFRFYGPPQPRQPQDPGPIGVSR
jgi:cell wall-associated NlpC family hydrolase